MGSRKLIIFDWDGTLMDSTDRIVECMRGAALEAGLPDCPAQAVRGIIGLGLPEAIRTLYPRIDDEQLGTMRECYSRRFVDAEREPSSLFPGVWQVLELLRRERTLMAVATGKSRRGLDRVWRQSGLGEYFVSSRCADESGSKPHPAMVEEILLETGVAQGDALVVGDTTFDLEMARGAGVEAAGVTWGAHPRSKLLECQPLALLERMDELPGLLRPAEMI